MGISYGGRFPYFSMMLVLFESYCNSRHLCDVGLFTDRILFIGGVRSIFLDLLSDSTTWSSSILKLSTADYAILSIFGLLGLLRLAAIKLSEGCCCYVFYGELKCYVPDKTVVFFFVFLFFSSSLSSMKTYSISSLFCSCNSLCRSSSSGSHANDCSGLSSMLKFACLLTCVIIYPGTLNPRFGLNASSS